MPDLPPPKKALVTGGLGFIGSELCRSLVRAGMEIVIVDDMSRGCAENIAGLPARVIRADVKDSARMRSLVDEVAPTVVIHLAAVHHIPDCNRDPVRCMEVNVVGTECLLYALRERPPSRLIVTSSMAVYPPRDEPHRESDPAVPVDVYGQSKLVNEMQARRFYDEACVTTIAVRLSNAYGPRETNPHVIPEIMRQLKQGTSELRLGNIEPKRDYIHTSDVAEAYNSLASTPVPEGFYVVNLGTGKEYSVREILTMLSALTGKSITTVEDVSRVRKVERMHLLPDIGKIKRLTNWHPRMEMREGLRQLCEWYGLV